MIRQYEQKSMPAIGTSNTNNNILVFIKFLLERDSAKVGFNFDFICRLLFYWNNQMIAK